MTTHWRSDFSVAQAEAKPCHDHVAVFTSRRSSAAMSKLILFSRLFAGETIGGARDSASVARVGVRNRSLRTD